ncbi:MAG: hypothetical protein ACRDQZ_06015, partial [Mycobacteriales bacterium]
MRLRFPALATSAAGVALVTAAAGFAHAQLARRGGEFPVNTVIDGDQRGSRVVATPDGGFVVIWKGDHIAARRFDADTRPLAPEFGVNSSPIGSEDASVAAASDGSFLVAWYGAGVDARYVNPADRPGAQFVVTPQSYVGSGVAAAGGGQFTVAWTDTDYHAEARLVGPHGQAPSFRINEEGYQYKVAAAGSGDGEYRVVWFDGGGLIRGRSFIGSQPTADAFDVANVSSTFNQGPVICSDSTGGFVVAWATYSYGKQDGKAVSYRQYDATGAPLTDALPITPEEGPSVQVNPQLACGPGSDFVVVWGEIPFMPSQTPIRGRAVTPNGPHPSSDFTIRLRDAEDSDGAAVAALADGDLLVTWTDCGLPSGCDIFGQRFTSSGATDCP